MQLIGSLFSASSSINEEIEPIDYGKILKNPPKWVEDMRKEKIFDSSEETRDVETLTEKAALYAISAMIAICGLSLIITGVFLPIPTAGIVLICLLGFAIASAGVFSFAATYKKETIESV